MVAIIFGASGLIGSSLLEMCLQNERFTEVRAFGRRALPLQHAKLKQYTCTLETLAQVEHELKGYVVFNCLGTTIKIAGSQAEQYKIDCTYPIKIAELANTNQVNLMISVSSVGAASTGNFYLRTKFDMEEGVKKYFGNSAYFMRPSLLTGARQSFRLGEKLGQAAFYLLNFLMIGSLRQYRSISSKYVANAMLNAALKPNQKTVWYFDDMLNV